MARRARLPPPTNSIDVYDRVAHRWRRRGLDRAACWRPQDAPGWGRWNGPPRPPLAGLEELYRWPDGTWALRSANVPAADWGVAYTIPREEAVAWLDHWGFELPAGEAPLTVPRWDNAQRELWLGEQVIRIYRQHPAQNQVRVLEAFQAAGWPSTVESPFDRETTHDTLRQLNRGLEAYARRHRLRGRTLRFARDGTGELVLWQFVPVRG